MQAIRVRVGPDIPDDHLRECLEQYAVEQGFNVCSIRRSDLSVSTEGRRSGVLRNIDATKATNYPLATHRPAFSALWQHLPLVWVGSEGLEI